MPAEISRQGGGSYGATAALYSKHLARPPVVHSGKPKPHKTGHNGQRPRSAAAVLTSGRTPAQGEGPSVAECRSNRVPEPSAPCAQATWPSSASATLTARMRASARPAHRRPFTAVGSASKPVAREKKHATESSYIELRVAHTPRRRGVVSADGKPTTAHRGVGANEEGRNFEVYPSIDGYSGPVFGPAWGCDGGGKMNVAKDVLGESDNPQFWHEFEDFGPDPGVMQRAEDFVTKILRTEREGNGASLNEATLSPTGDHYSTPSAVYARDGLRTDLRRDKVQGKAAEAKARDHAVTAIYAGRHIESNASPLVSCYATSVTVPKEAPFPSPTVPRKSIKIRPNAERFSDMPKVDETKSGVDATLAHTGAGGTSFPDKEDEMAHARNIEQAAIISPLALDMFCSLRPTLRRPLGNVVTTTKASSRKHSARKRQRSLITHFYTGDIKPPPHPPPRLESPGIDGRICSWTSVFGAACEGAALGRARADVLKGARRRVRQQRRFRTRHASVRNVAKQETTTHFSDVDPVMTFVHEVASSSLEVSADALTDGNTDQVKEAIPGVDAPATEQKAKDANANLGGGDCDRTDETVDNQNGPEANFHNVDGGKHQTAEQEQIAPLTIHDPPAKSSLSTEKDKRSDSSSPAAGGSSRRKPSLSPPASGALTEGHTGTSGSALPSPVQRQPAGRGPTRMGVVAPCSLQVSTGKDGFSCDFAVACTPFRTRQGKKCGQPSGLSEGGALKIQRPWTSVGAYRESRRDERIASPEGFDELSQSPNDRFSGPLDSRPCIRALSRSDARTRECLGLRSAGRSEASQRPWTAGDAPSCGDQRAVGKGLCNGRSASCAPCVDITKGSSSCLGGRSRTADRAGSLWSPARYPRPVKLLQRSEALSLEDGASLLRLVQEISDPIAREERPQTRESHFKPSVPDPKEESPPARQQISIGHQPNGAVGTGSLLDEQIVHPYDDEPGPSCFATAINGVCSGHNVSENAESHVLLSVINASTLHREKEAGTPLSDKRSSAIEQKGNSPTHQPGGLQTRGGDDLSRSRRIAARHQTRPVSAPAKLYADGGKFTCVVSSPKLKEGRPVSAFGCLERRPNIQMQNFATDYLSADAVDGSNSGGATSGEQAGDGTVTPKEVRIEDATERREFETNVNQRMRPAEGEVRGQRQEREGRSELVGDVTTKSEIRCNAGGEDKRSGTPPPGPDAECTGTCVTLDECPETCTKMTKKAMENSKDFRRATLQLKALAAETSTAADDNDCRWRRSKEKSEVLFNDRRLAAVEDAQGAAGNVVLETRKLLHGIVTQSGLEESTRSKREADLEEIRRVLAQDIGMYEARAVTSRTMMRRLGALERENDATDLSIMVEYRRGSMLKVMQDRTERARDAERAACRRRREEAQAMQARLEEARHARGLLLGHVRQIVERLAYMKESAEVTQRWCQDRLHERRSASSTSRKFKQEFDRRCTDLDARLRKPTAQPYRCRDSPTKIAAVKDVTTGDADAHSCAMLVAASGRLKLLMSQLRGLDVMHNLRFCFCIALFNRRDIVSDWRLGKTMKLTCSLSGEAAEWAKTLDVYQLNAL